MTPPRRSEKPEIPDRKLPPKYVKRAKAWCVTVFKDGIQTQEWSIIKPT